MAEERPYTLSAFRKESLATGESPGTNDHDTHNGLSAWHSECVSLITRKDAVLSRQKIKEASQTYWICDVSATKDDLGFRTLIPLPEGLASDLAMVSEERLAAETFNHSTSYTEDRIVHFEQMPRS